MSGMRHGLNSQNYMIAKLRKGQRGYMLITLPFALALVTIALLAALPEIGQQIKRDREEELRHRGTAYMRAIQHFYRRFGRYPTRIEELENTDNVRLLRKRYTDPTNIDRETGKERDFKFLHPTDISLSNGPVLGQATGQSSQGQTVLAGGPAGLSGPQSALGDSGAHTGGIQQEDDGSQGPPSGPSTEVADATADATENQTFGGGPIVGVASTSTAKSIRVFYQKNHYKDWLFIYVPPDRGAALLIGPVNPGFPANTFEGMTGLSPGAAASVAPEQGGTGQATSSNNGQSQNQQSQPPPN
jgi:type II secretory pathway pseudopilin PulG